MNLCSDNHDEVCFEGRACPACAKIKEYEQQLKDMRHEAGEYLDRIAELHAEINELKEEPALTAIRNANDNQP